LMNQARILSPNQPTIAAPMIAPTAAEMMPTMAVPIAAPIAENPPTTTAATTPASVPHIDVKKNAGSA
jgi:hypothetical protein